MVLSGFILGIRYKCQAISDIDNPWTSLPPPLLLDLSFYENAAENTPSRQDEPRRSDLRIDLRRRGGWERLLSLLGLLSSLSSLCFCVVELLSRNIIAFIESLGH